MQATVYANLSTRRLTTTLGGSAVSFPAFVQGDKVRQLVGFGESLGIPVKYIALVDYANSRGALDMGLHDMRDTDAGSMLRVKGVDGFCPIGPGLVCGIDIRAQTLRTYRNGRLVQEGVLADELIFGFDYLVADLARHITLMPGDLILTATPANSRPLEVGDLIEVEVTGLGRLSNRVVAAPAPRAQVGHQPNASAEVVRVALGNDDRLPESVRPR